MITTVLTSSVSRQYTHHYPHWIDYFEEFGQPYASDKEAAALARRLWRQSHRLATSRAASCIGDLKIVM